jgi:hypothetical protein
MGKSIISLLLLLTAWLPGTSVGDELTLAESAPDRYVVVKGDTLWDISARFLRDPWRWPDIWGLNKDQIKNPHWIYPGDPLLLLVVRCRRFQAEYFLLVVREAKANIETAQRHALDQGFYMGKLCLFGF